MRIDRIGSPRRPHLSLIELFGFSRPLHEQDRGSSFLADLPAASFSRNEAINEDVQIRRARSQTPAAIRPVAPAGSQDRHIPLQLGYRSEAVGIGN
jgi:hypothetical protein